MMNVSENIKQVYFIGIGGIGMSAIARFYHLKGLKVAGYDRTPSVVTDALEKEGIPVVFSDEVDRIDSVFMNADSTLVVYTPAVEASHRQLVFFRQEGYPVLKRSQILGLITAGLNAVCVAGTHGKTTISTLTAHLFTHSQKGCTAFLGGISKNYGTNFLWNDHSPFVVLEADEFDRSFLTLSPGSALVSSVDSDHLDIYENRENLLEAFQAFGHKVKNNGFLVTKNGLPVDWQLQDGVKVFSYALNGPADFYATNLTTEGNLYRFDLVTPSATIEGLQLGIPGLLNVENAVGACALALLNGVTHAEIRAALPGFKGIARRFDMHVNTPEVVYIDDYAHHPEEIRATVRSIKALFPNHYLLGIFQPHLYTRTRDFADEFAQALGELDELVLLDIYPAREQPIEGVSSQIIFNGVGNIPATIVSKEALPGFLTPKLPMVVITMGAGDIDREVEKVKNRVVSFLNKK